MEVWLQYPEILPDKRKKSEHTALQSSDYTMIQCFIYILFLRDLILLPPTSSLSSFTLCRHKQIQVLELEFSFSPQKDTPQGGNLNLLAKCQKKVI